MRQMKDNKWTFFITSITQSYFTGITHFNPDLYSSVFKISLPGSGWAISDKLSLLDPPQALCCSVSKIKPKGGAWSKAAVSKVQEWFGPPMTKNFSFEIVAKRGTKNAVKISIENGLCSFELV